MREPDGEVLLTLLKGITSMYSEPEPTTTPATAEGFKMPWRGEPGTYLVVWVDEVGVLIEQAQMRRHGNAENWYAERENKEHHSAPTKVSMYNWLSDGSLNFLK